ncbi:hypothetical protein [Glaciecola sp. KUL10]|jgi:hypothetical protein|uniref:hypothetical protein n=1 Tax=Glaciecola sp. (strain KUL10) TaxID=2161813 RepID=UPI000D9A456F|nr:hypothetical protein [Glaciecola sp. KUL10]GBL03378.1 hypothetical protein KUL10_06660 [Glaciecola sp. KUL10]
MTAIMILAVLFIALIVIVPLIEKSNMRVSPETQAKMGKWIWPLLVILLVSQLIMMMF